jgi:hypothetical protein
VAQLFSLGGIERFGFFECPQVKIHIVKTYIALILSCASMMGADTGIRVTTWTTTSGFSNLVSFVTNTVSDGAISSGTNIRGDIRPTIFSHTNSCKACAKNPRLHHRPNSITFSFTGNSTSPTVGTAFAYLPSKFRERQFLTGTAYKIAEGVVLFCPSRPKIDSN